MWARYLTFFLLLLLLKAAAYADPMNSASLMISIDNKDIQTNFQIVKNTLKATQSTTQNTGKVVFVTYNSETTEQIKEYIEKNLSQYSNSYLIFQEGNKNYRWLRDLAMGWEKTSDGIYRIINNPRPEFKADYVAKIADLLAYCTNKEIGFSIINKINDYKTVDGGDFISDGAGTCVVRNVESAQTTAADLGCTKIIKHPEVKKNERFPHDNHHIDIFTTFLAPNLALVSEVPESCKDTLSKAVKNRYETYAKILINQNVKVVRFPLALGCPKIEGSRGRVAIRSYTNLTQIKGAYLVPEFKATKEDKFGQSQLDQDNQKFVDFLTDLIEKKLIPSKAIISLPIENDKVLTGGAVRCLSWEIPNSLKSCTQDNFDEAYAETAIEIKLMALNLSQSSNSKYCEPGRDLYRSAVYSINEHKGRFSQSYTDQLMTSKGVIMGNSNFHNIIKESLVSLRQELLQKCNFRTKDIPRLIQNNSIRNPI